MEKLNDQKNGKKWKNKMAITDTSFCARKNGGPELAREAIAKRSARAPQATRG